VNLPRIYDRKDKPDVGAVNIADWLKEFLADCGAVREVRHLAQEAEIRRVDDQANGVREKFSSQQRHLQG